MKKTLLRYLLSPDPAEGAVPEVTLPASPAAGPTPGEPPPAATVVLNGDVTEELVQTRSRLDKTEREKKLVETRASELEDENRRLKQAGLQPAPSAVDKRSALEKFMETGETD